MGIANKSNNVLLCPLDWGLGHVARIVPIIRRLQKRGYTVYVACSDKQYYFLQQEVENIEWIPCSSPKIEYRNGPLRTIDLIKLIPKIYVSVVRDRRKLKKIIKQYSFAAIISDNRYGCFHKDIPSVIITHQLSIKLPKKVKWAEDLINSGISHLIKRFSYCWVPDVVTIPNYAGDLSFNKRLSPVYIGLLSRFEGKNANQTESTYEVLGIVSGPEPQRTIFEQQLLTQMKSLQKPCVLVSGNVKTNLFPFQDDNVMVYPLATSDLLLNFVAQSKYIVSRSGYSTIMDLIHLKRTAVLVPTPGQTEQEYLAEYYNMRKLFVVQSQQEFDLQTALCQLSVYSMNIRYVPDNKLDKAIDDLLGIKEETNSEKSDVVKSTVMV